MTEENRTEENKSESIFGNFLKEKNAFAELISENTIEYFKEEKKT